ncbi:hypothetical protein JI435_440690 [Parastagonospora nodorum SN15]|nr:hypothetical protein JI435_440690 [Parastagonospora nodorum SN15]
MISGLPSAPSEETTPRTFDAKSGLADDQRPESASQLRYTSCVLAANEGKT